MVATDGDEAQTERTPVREDATDDETVSTTIPMCASGGKAKKRKKKKAKKPSAASSSQLPDDISSYWSTDKFKVSKDPGAGRCLIATKNLPAGDLLFEELPFAKVIRRDCALHYCAVCCQPVHGATRIQTDDFTVYCSTKCKADEDDVRKGEEAFMKVLERVSIATDVDADLLRMMVRLAVSRAFALGLHLETAGKAGARREGDEELEPEAEPTHTNEDSFHVKRWLHVRSLMHHREKMSKEWVNVVRAAAAAALESLPGWSRCDVEEMVDLACRVNVNAHGLRDESGGSNKVIGLGMFPLTAMMNHSCRPNCTYVFHRGKMWVRTLHELSVGTELTLHYVDLLQSTEDRRKELMSSKFFLCRCVRCEGPDAADSHLGALCCAECGEKGWLTSKPPPSPEEAIAAQLALLGNDLGKAAVRTRTGRGGDKGRKGSSLPAKNSAEETSAGGTPSAATCAQPLEGSAANGEAREKVPSGSCAMYCSSCGRQYPAADCEEVNACARADWDIATSILGTGNYGGARRKLEKWQEDHDAGAPALPRSSKRRTAKRTKIKLHPMNSMVIQSAVRLANCCNYEGDFASSSRHLRRVVSAMEAVYPPNFPELGDFYAALADALKSYLDQQGHSMPPKSRDSFASERKRVLSKALGVRSVSLGDENVVTKLAWRELDRA